MQDGRIDFDGATPVLGRDEWLTVGLAVWVPYFTRSVDGAVVCNPVSRQIAYVGASVVIFDDGTDQLCDCCFPATLVGRKACEAVCQRFEIHQRAFRWPVVKG